MDLETIVVYMFHKDKRNFSFHHLSNYNDTNKNKFVYDMNGKQYYEKSFIKLKKLKFSISSNRKSSTLVIRQRKSTLNRRTDRY